MGAKKIWVKRPGASATLISINTDDLVDDVREVILKKYANSLGRTFDSPDVTLRIIPRELPTRQLRFVERTLSPEEAITSTLEDYFPGGQTVNDALIIDVPIKRTPRQSPRTSHLLSYYTDDARPGESGSDYFPPMPHIASPHPPTAPTSNAAAQSAHPSLHSISVLNTGQVPSLPSPGSTRNRHHPRPRVGRTHTSSPPIAATTPTVANNGNFSLRHPPSRAVDLTTVDGAHPPPLAPPLPSPTIEVPGKVATPPHARIASPRLNPTKGQVRAENSRGLNAALDGAVPPINCLIVEDNIINLKLLEAFMKRLKVRWQSAMNGKEAVHKWRTGGFHLVLMDIQLPVMNGLDATKEIRRLERMNSIGVFSSSAASAPTAPVKELSGDDGLPNTHLFKSPVIIVALTASSLQSDRHEALAAGCNDFLTKPVNFVWLERKVMEWGCMQALIDFDGWRKWKDFSQGRENGAASDAKATNNTKGVVKGMRKDKPRQSGGPHGVNGADGVDGGRAITAGA
ncbi:MAG: hypothetical protein M1825_001288 [Sarcosagium campestre]|nr:MAG: hypothetical protein M1825_001288 [Sarcosagium campestre]